MQHRYAPSKHHVCNVRSSPRLATALRLVCSIYACAARPSTSSLAEDSHLASGCYQGWWWGMAGRPRSQCCVLVQATQPAFACPSTIQILRTPPTSVATMSGAAIETVKHLIQFARGVNRPHCVAYNCTAYCTQNRTALRHNCVHKLLCVLKSRNDSALPSRPRKHVAAGNTPWRSLLACEDAGKQHLYDTAQVSETSQATVD